MIFKQPLEGSTMIIKSERFSLASADTLSTPATATAAVTDHLSGALHIAGGGADVQPAIGNAINPEHAVDGANHLADNANHPTSLSALPPDRQSISDSANVTEAGHAIDHPQSTFWNPTDFTSAPGETHHTSLVDSLSHKDLSGIFDHLDTLSGGATGSAFDGEFNPSLSSLVQSSHASPIGLPDILSDALDVFSSAGSPGGQHGGGGSGGGTAPKAYDTNSGTGVDFHVTYDSSVGNAPSGFISVVQHVADFFATSFQNPIAGQHLTINIDVGYGEVDNMRMGPGAVGESATNLLSVTDSALRSAYSSSYLNDVHLGTSAAPGNLYVSYAEGKALGFSVPNAIDGYVGFSSQKGIFDYNNTDGVSSGQYDAFGVVAHEFSEVMGRILLVGATINNAPSYMAFDLFHDSSPGVQNFFGNGGYFSTDNGSTTLAVFNNSSNGGDAGDWASGGTKDNIYDAFNAFGTSGHVAPVTNVDLWTLHAVGFDLAHPVTV
jgi:hypothetical protein